MAAKFLDRAEQSNKALAVGYLRMSTDEQDRSIGDQQKDILAYAAKHGFKIIRWYKDEGISGNKQGREQFQKLIADVGSIHDFDAIICWSQDRFSRFDNYDIAVYWKTLRDADVRLIFTVEGEFNFDDFGDFLKATVTQKGANDYLLKLSRSVSRGLRSVASAGFWPAGRAPFGYKIVKAENDRSRLEVHPEQSPHVAKMFDLWVNDRWSARQIAIHFNRLGVRNNLGREWSLARISTMLKNEVYTGTLVYGREGTGDHGRIIGKEYVPNRRQAAKRTRQTRDACIVVPHTHAAIVTRHLFEQAQERFGEKAYLRQRSRRKTTAVSGLLWCGHCGSKMGVRYFRNSQGKRYAEVRCNSLNFNTTDSVRPECRCCIPLHEVLDAALDRLEQDHLSQEQINRYRSAFVDFISDQRGERSKSAKGLGKTIAEVTAKLEKAESRIIEVPDDMLPPLWRQIRELRERKASAEAELAAQSRIGDASERAIVEEANKLAADLKRCRVAMREIDPEIARPALESILTKIELFSCPAEKGQKRKRKLYKIRLHCKSPIATVSSVYLKQQTDHDSYVKVNAILQRIVPSMIISIAVG